MFPDVQPCDPEGEDDISHSAQERTEDDSEKSTRLQNEADVLSRCADSDETFKTILRNTCRCKTDADCKKKLKRALPKDVKLHATDGSRTFEVTPYLIDASIFQQPALMEKSLGRKMPVWSPKKLEEVRADLTVIRTKMLEHQLAIDQGREETAALNNETARIERQLVQMYGGSQISNDIADSTSRPSHIPIGTILENEITNMERIAHAAELTKAAAEQISEATKGFLECDKQWKSWVANPDSDER